MARPEVRQTSDLPLRRFEYDYAPEASKASHYYVSKVRGEQRDISRDDLTEALHNPDHPAAKALLQNISRAASNLEGTRCFWYKKRCECEAFAYCLGVPAAFIR